MRMLTAGSFFVALLAVAGYFVLGRFSICVAPDGPSTAPPVFESTLAFTVHIVRPDGEDVEVGKTPGQVPVTDAHRVWYVRPQLPRTHEGDLEAHVADLEGKQVPGLSLRGMEWITDGELARLKRLPELRYLDLTDCWRTTDAGIAHLASLKRIEWLMLHGCNSITDEGLASVKQLEELHTLDLWGCCPVTGFGMEQLANLKKLDHLVLTNHCHYAGLDKLADLPIRVLDLSGWQWLPSSGLDGLKEMKGLDELHLAGCPQIDDKGLKFIAVVTTLKVLRMPDSPVSNAGLALLAPLTKLQRIELPLGLINDEGLAHLTKLTELTALDLRRCKVTDAGLATLTRLTKLTSLDLSRCRVLTDAGFARVAELKGLRRLDLRENPQLSAETVTRLRKALPGCEVVTDGAWTAP